MNLPESPFSVLYRAEEVSPVYGAPASTQLKLGKMVLGIPTVFTQQGAPDGFAKWSFKADGIMGNALVWDGMVVLDLTANVQFSFIR